MSVERSFEAWGEVQRQGYDFADRLAQGFTGLIQAAPAPPSFPWPPTVQKPLLELPVGINGSAILDIGDTLGKAGLEFRACLNGMVEQIFNRLPLPSVVPVLGQQEEDADLSLRSDDGGVNVSGFGKDEYGTSDFLRILGCGDDCETDADLRDDLILNDPEILGFDLTSAGVIGKPQGTVNITSTYDSRNGQGLDTSFMARGDLWRLEASGSQGSLTSGNNHNSSNLIVQLGPLLFVRHTTLMLPVHKSRQHLIWYGYDRKNRIHSVCPAVWSKHRRWLLMSMICLNPLLPTFLDLQFPNGQLTYESGEGLTTSVFTPFCGGLLQAQGQYPGEMAFSFSCKNKRGTRFAPTLRWPDKSVTLGLAQALAWQRCGVLVRPTVQLSVLPTFGGCNPGLRVEVIHSVNEQLSLAFGYSAGTPMASVSISVGRSKWNGHVGSSGVVLNVETPLSGVSRPSFSVQVNSGIEF